MEVFVSNLGRVTSYPEDFCGFRLSFHANAGMAYRSGHALFLPDFFEFIIHRLATENIVI
jgi:hypothetical protein